MGRCNGCELKRYKKELGDKFLMLDNTIYKLDSPPRRGQGQPAKYKGRSIEFYMWGMSFEHSRDEDCFE